MKMMESLGYVGLEPRRQLSALDRGEGPSVYSSTVEESQGQARL